MEEKDYILVTKRLRLELLEESDAEEIWKHVSNPEISKQMSWDTHKNIHTTIDFLKAVQESFRKETAISWKIKFENKIVGVFSIISILRKHRSLTYDKAELAYWLGYEYQGQGIMTEAGEKVLNFAFNRLNLHKIFVGHHVGNIGSEGLIKRLKFRFSHIERESFMKNNEWVDVNYYEMLKKEYEELYK